MKLLIGTQNPAKQAEHLHVLTKLAKKHTVDLQLVFPRDLGVITEPKETGSTIEENSLIKARYYFEKSGIPTLTDDGAFEIDSLGGAPGVHAKYWADKSGDDSKIIAKTLAQLAKFLNKTDRAARLTICLTYYDGDITIQEIESIEGYVAQWPHGNTVKGFPYRALFIVAGVEKYYDELTPNEHARFNHREKALKKLFGKIFVYDRHS